MEVNLQAIAAMSAVTVSREYGSGGGEIAARLARKLGWQLIDHAVINPPVALSKTEWNAVRRCAEQAARRDHGLAFALAALFHYAGQRVSEVVALHIPDVQASQRRVLLIIRRGKGLKKGLGKVFLDGIKQHTIPHHTGTIVLDCWAGNDKLRDFYLSAGFTFHGIFPENDYQVAIFVS